MIPLIFPVFRDEGVARRERKTAQSARAPAVFRRLRTGCAKPL
jgi:hypothetical protein